MTTDSTPPAGFGRRAGPASASTLPKVVKPEPLRKAMTAKSAPDPELVAWNQSRAGKRRMTWIICALLVLGGPMSLLLPEGLGQIGGFGLLGLAVLSFTTRFRKAA